MADIESVKEHFTDCINCAESKGNSWVFVMVDKLKDALELLKEKEQAKVIFMPHEGVYQTECGNCGQYLDKAYSVCPGCGKKLDWNSNQT